MLCTTCAIVPRILASLHPECLRDCLLWSG